MLLGREERALLELSVLAEGSVCAVRRTTYFPCSAILASEDQRNIFPNTICLTPMVCCISHGLGGNLNMLGRLWGGDTPFDNRPVLANGLGLESGGE